LTVPEKTEALYQTEFPQGQEKRKGRWRGPRIRKEIKQRKKG